MYEKLSCFAPTVINLFLQVLVVFMLCSEMLWHNKGFKVSLVWIHEKYFLIQDDIETTAAETILLLDIQSSIYMRETF